ncbi:hypothetical protein JYU34_009812 [Plutella xylostella]|uniref:FP protein C-terminal domain-containing protein n=1 Tax=Plutella xylostella TaxID=51655 RepID=A0ABQ7QKK0_PLUXY|nr:hypothetical protein JYU34_009812 [Plutella xylostella]
MICPACEKPIGDRELLRCTACNKCYNFQCVNISVSYYQANLQNLRRLWQCPECNGKINTRRRGDSTPIRRLPDAASAGAPDMDMSCEEIEPATENAATHRTGPGDSDSITYDKFAELMDKKLEYKLGTKIDSLKCILEGKLEAMISKFESNLTNISDTLSTRMQQACDDIISLNKRLLTVELENQQLRSDLSAANANHNAAAGPGSEQDGTIAQLQESIAELRSDLNEREQSALLTDIEISGIPELDGESPLHIVMAVAKKLGTILEERDIVSAMRMGPRRIVSISSSGPTSRPRPLVIRLARRATRDELIKCSRVRRGATTTDLGLAAHDPKPFYLNERLTKFNRILFGKVRVSRQQKNWKHAWTRDGRIYARQTDVSPAYLIRSEADLEHIFGVNLPKSST